MRITPTLSLLAVCFQATVVALAAPKTIPKQFTILGGQTITHAIAADGPASTETESVKIEVTGLMTTIVNGGKSLMNRTFGFTTKVPLTIRRVVVEEVSGAVPEVLVTDETPKLDKNYWRGDAGRTPLTPAGNPWLFESGDDWRVFRFTITTEEKGAMVLLQPSCIPETSKRKYVQLAKQAARAPSDAQIRRYLDSAGKVFREDVPVLFMPVVHAPAGGSGTLRENLKTARKKKAAVVLACEQLDWAVELVSGALARRKKASSRAWCWSSWRRGPSRCCSRSWPGRPGSPSRPALWSTEISVRGLEALEPAVVSGGPKKPPAGA